MQQQWNGIAYNSKKHGIKLRFPAGAVTKGTLDVEVGVLLSGPFTFSANVKPVSPILWLCVKENRYHRFSKPISVTLPHFLDCNLLEEQNKFAFFTATHNDSVTDQLFTFKEVSADHCKFLPSSGTLTTRRCCFICIAYKEPEDMINKSNYCLICVTPRNIVQPRFIMHFYLTFDLKTYIEVCTVARQPLDMVQVSNHSNFTHSSFIDFAKSFSGMRIWNYWEDFQTCTSNERQCGTATCNHYSVQHSSSIWVDCWKYWLWMQGTPNNN